MLDKIKNILFEWPDPDDTALAKVNKDYDALMEQFKYLDYSTYLRTKHWMRFKEEALKNTSYKCQACNINTTDLSVYHKSTNNLGRETFDDIIILCENCHANFLDQEK